MASDNHTHVFLEKHVPDPGADEMVAGYLVIKRFTEALGFEHYSNFIDCTFRTPADRAAPAISHNREVAPGCQRPVKELCFSGTKAYDQIREATDLFIGSAVALFEDCCKDEDKSCDESLADAEQQPRKYDRLMNFDYDIRLINQRFDFHAVDGEMYKLMFGHLSDPPGGLGPRTPEMLTVMRQQMQNQPGLSLLDHNLGSGNLSGLLLCKLKCPPLLELIWSYWMEQGMLVQGINALSLRFQNRRYPGHEALQRCDISPLRPLNNVFWGYLQREPDRLTIARRAYEYDHHYGLRIRGTAVPPLTPADSRTRFIEAFHRLLQEANRYYRTSMDTTMNADAFPALNCLRELHLLLAEGAHNQFGDLPTTARAEMLIQQWLLARPEVRDFLGGRPAVPYPEPWMPHMDTLRGMMGWNDASIRHYRDLAVYGEQLLLSVRYLPWSTVNNSTAAAAWLTFWRPEVQGYLHSYRAVTGVDLGATEVPVTQGGLLTAQPADLIGRARTAVTAQRLA